MTRKRNRNPYRHRLLIYYHITQRWRVAPLLIAFFGAVLYGASWMAYKQVISGMNNDLLLALWESRVVLLVLVGLSLLLYILMIIIGRGSYVEVRPRALRVRAGIVPLDISYGRIRSIRLVELATQHPPQTLKARDRKIVDLYLGESCSAIDLQSWPKQPIKRLWHKFMFTAGYNSLLFIVKDAMTLNQQIDGAIARRQARMQQGRRYQDPITRAGSAPRKDL
jgi:hypothetical protein